MNGGLVSNHDILMSNPNYANVKYSSTKFKKEDFGQGKSFQDYVMISRLKIDEVSSPYMSEDIRNNQLSKIIKLKQIIPTHTASLSEDYLDIEMMALEMKKEKIFNEWMKEKIDGFYIFVDPEFRNGEFSFPNWIK
jgi:peptidyl-prolyl cis-trans isomerase SurA